MPIVYQSQNLTYVGISLRLREVKNLLQVGEQGEGGGEEFKQSSENNSKSNLAKSQTNSKPESKSSKIRGKLPDNITHMI